MELQKYDFVREIEDGLFYCFTEDGDDDCTKLTHYIVTDTQEVQYNHSPYSMPATVDVLRVARQLKLLVD